jgi:hypothetical protein
MRRQTLGPWILALLLGCGGPPAEAESGEPASEIDPALAEGGGDATEPSEPGAAPGLKESGAKPEPTGDDLTTVLQLVIDDPELDPYLKLGEAGRFPLKMSGEKIAGLKLVKATKPVEIVDAPKSNKDAVLVITEIDLQGTKASVRYTYPIEGIRGTATLTKGPQGWELKNSRVVEHKNAPE